MRSPVNEINTNPTARFSVTPTGGTVETLFSFDASASSDAEDSTANLVVRWDWENDGTWDTGYSAVKTAERQYSSLGTKTIALEVKDSGQLLSRTNRSIEVLMPDVNTAPHAGFTAKPLYGELSTVFTMDASFCSDAEDSRNFLQVRWDWDNDGAWDTNFSTNKIASHQFSTIGEYMIKLEVKDTKGLTATAFRQVIIYSMEDGSNCVDFDGNVYLTTKIGSQWWMAENLKVTHFRNGESITRVTENFAWPSYNRSAYCEYENDLPMANIYGRLYNWYAANDNRQIAPQGWHIASDLEWKILEMYLGVGESQIDVGGLIGTDAGGKLKEIGTTHWWNPNMGATNETGFTALPAGFRHGDNGMSLGVGNVGYFWTATESESYRAWYHGLNSYGTDIVRIAMPKSYGLAVRCVKD